jgi:tetratricopeptide (TPR) repeat protein
LEDRYWCCSSCRKRVERDGLTAAIAESRKQDIAAATTFLKYGQSEAKCDLYANALIFFDMAIPTFEHFASLGHERSIDALATAKSERESAQCELDEDNRNPERVEKRFEARKSLVFARGRLCGWINLAQKGQTQDALTMLQDVIDACKKDGDDSAEWQRMHADALKYTGYLLGKMGRWSEALETFQESLRLWEALYQADDNYAEDVMIARNNVTEAVVRLSLSQGETPMGE